MIRACWLATLWACVGANDDQTTPTADDLDGDGVPDNEDCSPDDANIHPGRPDLCDLVDNDCDGSIDEDATLTTLFRDQDTDGFGDPSWTTESCAEQSGWTSDDSDCGPSDPTIYPNAPEYCDGKDHDCDGETMEDSAVDRSSWWADDDGDGFGAGDVLLDCELPGGFVGNNEDCDDRRADVSPRAPEVCDSEKTDEDCDGLINDADPWVSGGEAWYPDLDGDGWGDASATPVWSCEVPKDHVGQSEDCDDADSLVYPAANELCNGIDDDCDGAADQDATDAFVWYDDNDGDGYGDISAFSFACEAPPNTSALFGDCDDNNNTRHPGAVETDCSGSTDLNCDGLAGNTDSDGDGYWACEECDDAEADIFPGATEICDGWDNDCDGDVDGGAVDASRWYADDDADGFGNPELALDECTRPAGFVADNTDCNDSTRRAYPGAPETCATLGDDDCDGNSNEQDVIACVDWYEDGDLDGYGEASVCQCVASGEYQLEAGGDCDDDDAETFPGADDICGDSIDQDCSGADSACSLTDADGYWVGRADADGFGVWLGNLGDVDGDGRTDLLVGAVTADGAVADEGGAFWLDGPPGPGLIVSRPEQFWYGEATSDDAGGVVSGAADFDGDGVLDVLIAATSNDEAEKNAGRVYLTPLSGGTVALGASLLWANGLETHDHLGSGLLLGSDLDADGHLDAVMTASGTDATGGEAGTVYIFDQAWTGHQSASAADYVITGNDGDRLSALGDRPADVTGDGIDDLLVGGPGIDSVALDAGAVLVFVGPLRSDMTASDADQVHNGEATDDDAGAQFSARDFDGDGNVDLLVGAPGNDTAGTDAGAAYLVLGPLIRGKALATADLRMWGEAADDAFGSAVAGANLLSGSASSLFLGAPENDGGGSNAGAVYRFNGLPTGTLGASDADAIYVGEAAGAAVGTSLLFLDDHDADGREDVAIGAPGFVDGTGLVPGAVYVL